MCFCRGRLAGGILPAFCHPAILQGSFYACSAYASGFVPSLRALQAPGRHRPQREGVSRWPFPMGVR
ncbi:hypothetical protein PCL1606_24920 [Pseudomonas chlororaphis]|uniref:Uncharacterized protein n=1 Tax=Pseudomonas chlororaphis TaxID=587753 RepID=A0A0D5XYQ5_9PSED|nr:hypothetical protein PCL1606_24920 [Pseudomonas chlororaphis]